MAGRKNSSGNPTLYQGRKLQQAKRIGHLWPGPADPVSQLFVGSAKVLKELLVRCCFFQRVQLAAVQVFQQGIPQKVIIGGVTDDRGYRFEACGLYCPPPALTHNELIRLAIGFG